MGCALGALMELTEIITKSRRRRGFKKSTRGALTILEGGALIVETVGIWDVVEEDAVYLALTQKAQMAPRGLARASTRRRIPPRPAVRDRAFSESTTSQHVVENEFQVQADFIKNPGA